MTDVNPLSLAGFVPFVVGFGLAVLWLTCVFWWGVSRVERKFVDGRKETTWEVVRRRLPKIRWLMVVASPTAVGGILYVLWWGIYFLMMVVVT